MYFMIYCWKERQKCERITAFCPYSRFIFNDLYSPVVINENKNEIKDYIEVKGRTTYCEINAKLEVGHFMRKHPQYGSPLMRKFACKSAR